MGNKASGELSEQRLRAFLATVGNRATSLAVLVLLGGSGLSLLGNHRLTLDIDYDGEESTVDEFRALLEHVAAEMHIELEAVPLHRFIPLPPDADNRHIPVGRFGNLQVFVFDPYSIALSKLDRGFDSDIEDVVFLLRRGFVEIGALDAMITGAADSAAPYDLNLRQMRVHLGLAKAALTGN